MSADPVLGEYLPTGYKQYGRNASIMGGVFKTINLNLYHYGGLSPLRYNDPTGMFDEDSTVSDAIKNKYVELKSRVNNAAESIKRIGGELYSKGKKSGGEILDEAVDSTQRFIKERVTVTASGRVAYGVGVEGQARVDSKVIEEGVIVTGGYATGLGVSGRLTADVLLYDGGPTTGYAIRGSGCAGGGLGGCVSFEFNPVNRNFRLRLSGGLVAGLSIGVRPGYSSRFKPW